MRGTLSIVGMGPATTLAAPNVVVAEVLHQMAEACASEVARRRSLGLATDGNSQSEREGSAHAPQRNCITTPRPALGQRFRHKALIGSLTWTTNLMPGGF